MRTALLAPRLGCNAFSIRLPVVSLVPRSTTGYRLASLRDDGGPGATAKIDRDAGTRTLVDAGGVAACNKRNEE